MKYEKAIKILKKLLLNNNYLINYPITKITNEIPTEPLMLGRQTAKYLQDLLQAIDTFAVKLTPAGSTPQGSPMADLQTAADELHNRINSNTDNLRDRIEKLLSKSTFTI